MNDKRLLHRKAIGKLIHRLVISINKTIAARWTFPQSSILNPQSLFKVKKTECLHCHDTQHSAKILIIGPSWVGDMVMAQSLFKILKQRDPDVVINVLASDWTRALLNRMPEVNQAISMPLNHGEFSLKKRYQIGKALRGAQYDQAIVLPNSWKSALIPFFARIPIRTGWLGEFRYGLLNDYRVLNKKQYPLMIERFMALGLPKSEALLGPYPQPQLKINQRDVDVLMQKHELTADKPVLVLCPGNQYGPAKQWPADYFAAVANVKIADGWQVWLLGAGKIDEEAARIIQAQTQSQCQNFIGKTTLAEAIDLMSLAQAAVTNDSGLMHVASALDLPLVALYGSSSPSFTPPLNDRAKVLSLNLHCSPCFKRVCPFGHFKCLRDLMPEQVLKELP